MKLTEYVDLVEQELPQLQARLTPQAAPELLKMVATHLYMKKDFDSLLAQVTREQLTYLFKEGRTNFDIPVKSGPDTIKPKDKGRGPSDFA